MKQQVLVIHGGDAFNTYKEYLAELKTEKINLDLIPYKGWKDTLGEKLGKSFQVITPRMPSKDNAKYNEWKIWFEKYIPFLKQNMILVGHSLGGIFLAKYLSENRFPKKIKATFLVAAPYFSIGDRYSERRDTPKDWILPKSLLKFEKQGGKIFLYQSKGDTLVLFNDVKKYERELPSAHPKIFSNKGHFILEKFPEIVREIKSLS
ncbi:MAG TPA: alpha/beta hydrolase [Candidatus Paceibacterota bacterium]|nr:alpha/beta hydrolase [Candidatus Paceibacterota bacterium]